MKEEFVNKTNNTQKLNAFDLSSEIEQMKLEDSWEKTGRSAKTLHKENNMRLVLNAMKAGTVIKTHHAKGPISVQCLEGEIKFHTDERSVTLDQGRVLTLMEFVKHSVEAVTESSFLLTVALLPTNDET